MWITPKLSSALKTLVSSVTHTDQARAGTSVSSLELPEDSKLDPQIEFRGSTSEYIMGGEE